MKETIEQHRGELMRISARVRELDLEIARLSRDRDQNVARESELKGVIGALEYVNTQMQEKQKVAKPEGISASGEDE